MNTKRFFLVCFASTAAGVLVLSVLMSVIGSVVVSNPGSIVQSAPLAEVICSAFFHTAAVVGPVALLVVALSGAGALWHLRRTRKKAASHVLVFGILEGTVLIGGGWLAFTGSDWALPDYMMFGVGAICGAVTAGVFLAFMRVKNQTDADP